MITRVALPALFAALAFASAARAAAPDVPLRYSTDGDPACPPAEHVRAEIALRLAGNIPMPESVVVDIRREGAQHVATASIQVAGKPVERRRIDVRSSPCSCLAAAQYIATVVAFVLTPFGVCPPPADCPACPPCPAPAEPPTCAAAAAEEERAVQVGAALLGSAGLGPAPALGAAALVRLRWDHASVGLEAAGLFPRDGTGERGAPVSIGMLAAGIVPCLRVGAFSGCGLLHAGAITHDSALATTPEATVLLALGIRAGAEIPLRSGLALDVHGDLASVTTPPVTQFDGRRVWAAAVTGTVALGFVLRLGPL